MKYVSLFAGIGGFDLALKRLGHECVYANEWDKYSAQTYEKNFIRPIQSENPKESGSSKYPTNKFSKWEHMVDRRSITEVPTTDIPDHNLLVGGFPCQAFSIAGKRKGFDDTRGTLFFDVARIIKEKKPKYLLLENVKGLLSHDTGRTYKIILSTLTELGYDIQAMVLNSKNFGVPQNRERVFIVGHLRGTPRPKVFPIGANSQADIVLPTLTARYWGGQANGGYIGNKEAKVIEPDGLHPTLDANYYKGHSNQRRMLKQIVGGSQGERVYDTSGVSTTLAGLAGGHGAKTGLYAIPVLTPDRVEKRQNGRRFKNDGEPSFTLTGQDKHGVYDGMKIRRLTPVECERLQGFPDGWTEGVSDTQRYKQLGNAATVNVVEEIIKRI